MSNASIFNYGAGPACLPTAVLERIKADIPDWADGMSVLEISHRTPKFIDLTIEIENRFRRLLNIPDEFAVILMQGGARGQFSAIPLNLLQGSNTADYCVTGHWSWQAFNESKRYCDPRLVTPIPAEFTSIVDFEEWDCNSNAPYLHFTDNETIHGIEFPIAPPVKSKWLVSDMTSNIMSRAIDFSKFGMIYASAQKNLGIAGITVVVVRKSLLGSAHAFTPPIMNYENFHQTQSMFNTPAVFAWYVLGLMLEWVEAQGGCDYFFQLSMKRSQQIYQIIDQSNGFYINSIDKRYRSRLNIVFKIADEVLEKEFLTRAHAAGFRQLQGHKVIGGLRVSIYNAMSKLGVDRLAEFMLQFAQEHH